MKNLLYILFIFSLTTFSQQEVQKVEVIKTDSQIESFSKNIGTSELKIDFLSLLAVPALSVGYEKMNNTSTAYGARMLLSFDDRNSDITDKFSITPYYRLYFFESEDFGGKGLFTEVFSKFALGKTENYEYNTNTTRTKNYSDIALGVAIGRKWINRKGYTFEFLIGFGRNLIDENASPTIFSLSLGKRY